MICYVSRFQYTVKVLSTFSTNHTRHFTLQNRTHAPLPPFQFSSNKFVRTATLSFDKSNLKSH